MPPPYRHAGAATAALLLLVAAALVPAGAHVARAPSLTPHNLRVERLADPEALGIDTPHPELTWRWLLNGAATRGSGVPRASVAVAASLDALQAIDGIDDASAGAGTGTGTGSAPALLWRHTTAKTSAKYAGARLESAAKYYWRVCVDPDGAATATTCATASFVTGMQPGDAWKAKWIGGRQLRGPAWDVGGAIKSAVLSVSGLGFYEVLLNGAKVGDAVLDPGFSTNYTERILYATHDVTAAVAAAVGTRHTHGESQASASGVGTRASVVLAARVGAGKYSYSVNPYAVPGKDVFAFIAQLDVRYTSGARATFVTDSSWHTSSSPIVWENLYKGETYDARGEIDGWADADYTIASARDGVWSAAEVVVLPAGAEAALSARLFPPIRIVDVITPVNATQLNRQGSYVFDLGNNYAGVARVTLPAGVAPGARMVVTCTEYARVANDAGGPADLYGQRDTYVFSGAEAAGSTWAPTFVYHGFRYVRVDHYPGTAAEALGAVKGLYMHTDVGVHGRVAVSEATREGVILNAVHAMVVQTQRDNIHSIPTDCPQREKRGWMGDASWTAEEAGKKSGNIFRVGIYLDIVRLTKTCAPRGPSTRAGSQTKSNWPRSPMILPLFSAGRLRSTLTLLFCRSFLGVAQL